MGSEFCRADYVVTDGNSGGNYTVSTTTATGTITPKALTVSGLSSADKVYDGTTTAAVSGTAALQTAIAAGTGASSDGTAYSNDTVSLAGTAVGAFNTKDVLTANTVSYSGLSLSGADAGNYSLTQGSATQHITARTLTVGVTVSIGVAVGWPGAWHLRSADLAAADVLESVEAVRDHSLRQEATALVRLVQQADAALYCAKTEGRDRVCVQAESGHPGRLAIRAR